jgi:2-phospho-L-lactate/phosphoenolpyruvate guanylyltransferase
MWVLIPIKRFAQAKSRLAGSIEPAQRAALAAALAGIALRAALPARGVQRVFALTADPAAEHLARTLGAQVLPENPQARDFNGMLSLAFDELAARGAARICYLASDLPDVTSSDIESLCAAHEGGLSIGRAERDGGTNALLFDAPRRFEPAFGADSAARHLRNAESAGLPARWLHIPGISNDLDTPDLPAARLRLLTQGMA